MTIVSSLKQIRSQESKGNTLLSLKRIMLFVGAFGLIAAAGCNLGSQTTGTDQVEDNISETGTEDDAGEQGDATDDEDLSQLYNPVLPDIESIATGEELYRKTCITCHGDSGQGDGSASEELSASPANLSSNSTQSMTDGELFSAITNGREGTPMPAWRNGISEDGRWNIVNYIRTFATSPAD